MSNQIRYIMSDYTGDELEIVISDELINDEDSFLINQVLITREDWHKIVSFVNENFK